MFVIVAGCGRMGRHIAETLFESGIDVMAVDQSSDALDEFSESFMGFSYQGDASEAETLKSAGVHRADAFIACTASDEVNLLAAEIAREVYHVPLVIVRAVDPLKMKFFEQIGLQTVCPVLLGADAVLDALDT